MKIEFKVTGRKRKKLVDAIGEILKIEPKYLRIQNASYQVGCFTVDKEGSVTCSDDIDIQHVKFLLENIAEYGFFAKLPTHKETDGCISMPSEAFTKSDLKNLNDLLKSKGKLIQKALNVPDLSIITEETVIKFPWFKGEYSGEEIKAYTHFITAICNMARNQKYIVAKEKEPENQKYAFRCFLLRLGFIGDKFKGERKILLRNLNGSSAFKGEVKSDVSQ